jgi:hypothetical protein
VTRQSRSSCDAKTRTRLSSLRGGPGRPGNQERRALASPERAPHVWFPLHLRNSDKASDYLFVQNNIDAEDVRSEHAETKGPQKAGGLGCLSEGKSNCDILRQSRSWQRGPARSLTLLRQAACSEHDSGVSSRSAVFAGHLASAARHASYLAIRWTLGVRSPQLGDGH